jgi:AhpD family alkylhydroperoxidase
MRLREVERGDRLVWRFLIWLISLVSGMRLPDAARIVLYHRQFFGDPMSRWTHMAMRGGSDWTVGERELMAAMTAKWSACEFCVGAHGAIAARVLGRPVVDAALQDVQRAELPAGLLATLTFLEVLTRTPDTLTAEDARTVLREGITPQAMEDAIAVPPCSTSSAAARMPSTTTCQGTRTLTAPQSGCSRGATHSGRARPPSTQITVPLPMPCSGASWRAQERPVRRFATQWRRERPAARPWRHPTTTWPGRSARPHTRSPMSRWQAWSKGREVSGPRSSWLWHRPWALVCIAGGAASSRWRRQRKSPPESGRTYRAVETWTAPAARHPPPIKRPLAGRR